MKKLIAIFIVFIAAGISIYAYSSESEFFTEFRLIKQACYIIYERYYTEIKPDEMMQSILANYVKTLDPYSEYIPPKNQKQFDIQIKGNYGGIGAVIGQSKDKLPVIVDPFENSPAERAGLLPGDIFVMVDGQIVTGLSIDKIADILRDEAGKPVNLVMKRASHEKFFPVTFNREVIRVKSARGEIIDNTVGYLQIQGFKEDTLDQILKICQTFNSKGVTEIIVDLRNDPGGILGMAVSLSNLFLPKGTLVVSVKGRDPRSERKFFTSENAVFPDTPLIVLINEHSASASEIFAGAIKDHKRGILLGKKTFGKGSVQNTFPLGDAGEKGTLKLTVAKYFTPSGECIHEKGIEPDISSEYIKIPPEKAEEIRNKFFDTDEVTLTEEQVKTLKNINFDFVNENLASSAEISDIIKEAKEKTLSSLKRDQNIWYATIEYDEQLQAALRLIKAKRILSGRKE